MFSDYMMGNQLAYYTSPQGVVKVTSGKIHPTDTIQDQNFERVSTIALRGRLSEKDNQYGWTWSLKPGDRVLGLGETVRGMNKRGFVYESFCSDDPSHTPDKSALYAAHNFVIVQGESTWGYYVDSPSKVTFDIGFSHKDEMSIYLETPDFDLYFFEGSPLEITHTFRKLIGLSYIPPKWGLGYQQSRWSYENKEEVKALIEKFEAEEFPCDAIYLDIDYMVDFKDFTVDENKFPDFQNFIQESKAKGYRFVPIIDAGVKIQEGYDVYEEGLAKGYFCTDEEGKPFVGAVWPGLVHFPDFLNPEARAWFGAYYHRLLDQGIEGFWNDMNEPAIFYTPQGLKKAMDSVKAIENENIDIYKYFGLKDAFYNLANQKSDYQSMYHRVEGGRVNHYDVHNLYGYKMTQSAAEGFKAYQDDKRFLMITRASHIGMAKYSGIWTGDNASWWEHLKLNIQMMPGLNMAGFMYSGADVGGFSGNSSPELLTRWMQFGIFTPLFRNHSALGTRRQEPWAFDSETLERTRHAVLWRYALMPYLYSELMKTTLKGDMLFKPLSFEYFDQGSHENEDQLLWGDSVMLTPIYEQNAKSRYVYLPESMCLVKLKNPLNQRLEWHEVYEAGHHFVSVEMDEIPLWLRPNELVVLTEPSKKSTQQLPENLIVWGYVPELARYELYEDDGFEVVNELKKEYMTSLEVEKKDEGYQVLVDNPRSELKSISFYLVDGEGKVHVISQENVSDHVSWV